MSALENRDYTYRETISKLPDKERILYCEKWIDKTQPILVINKNLFPLSSI